MQKPTGYDEAKESYAGEFKQLPPGAYNCAIKDAHEIKSQSGKNMLQLWLDIADGEYKNYFHEQYVDRMAKGQNAKWGGIYNQLTENSSTGYFKGLIANIEESNPGYKFDWNEKTLVNKRIGGVFRREQFIAQDGQLKFSTKCDYCVAISRVKDIKPPEDKLLDKEKPSSAGSYNASSTNNNMVEIDVNDDLPF